jgi:hypothetical protein
MLVRHKPYSADSASWNNAGRYGIVDIYLGKGRWSRVKRSELICKSPTPEERKALQFYSPLWEDLQKEETWRTDNLTKDATGKIVGGTNLARIISVRSFLRFSQEIEQKLGTLIFAAASSLGAVYDLKYGVSHNYENQQTI